MVPTWVFQDKVEVSIESTYQGITNMSLGKLVDIHVDRRLPAAEDGEIFELRETEECIPYVVAEIFAADTESWSRDKPA